jgi:hypothetical protein
MTYHRYVLSATRIGRDDLIAILTVDRQAESGSTEQPHDSFTPRLFFPWRPPIGRRLGPMMLAFGLFGRMNQKKPILWIASPGES